MKKIRNPIICIFASVLLLGGSAFLATGADKAAAPVAPLIKNSEFKMLDEKGVPAGWGLNGNGASIVTENGVSAVQLKTTKIESVSATQELLLDPSWRILHFSYQACVKSIIPGKLGWNNARIALTFIGPEKKVTHMIAGEWKQPTMGWADCTYNVSIPAGATTVKISPAIFDSEGEWLLRGLKVEVAAKNIGNVEPGALLIANGEFKMPDSKGVPAAWIFYGPGASVVTEGGVAALSLKTAQVGSTSAVQELALDPSWGSLKFTFQVRVKSITTGKLNWNDARIALTFFGSDEKVTNAVAGNWNKPTDGWVDVSQNVPVPPGAVKLNISPAIFDTVGEWELRNLRVELAAKRGDRE